MNPPVNISQISNGFTAQQLQKAGGKTIIFTDTLLKAQCLQLAARMAI